MTTEWRDTGISVVGDKLWGSHLCHFYETREDLLDVLIPYFKTGLENNEFCMWVVFGPLDEEEARNALRRAIPDADRYLAQGSMEIISHSQWYLKDGVLDLQRVCDGWKEKLARALAGGHDGMRVSGNTAWLAKKDWKNFSEYENKLNGLLADQKMMVLCTYPLAKTRADEFFDVARTHQLITAKRYGNLEVLEIPDLKQTKAEMKKLNEQLEHLIRVHQSQKMEALGTLAGGIAHDFNNMLLPIMGYTEMALDELSPSSPVRKGLEEVLKASLRAKELVKQILAVSRFTQEQQRIPTDVSSIIKEVLKLLRVTLPTSIEIRQSIQAGAALVDPTQIHQVLMNLCTNAAHAMNGEGILEVRLSEVDLGRSDPDTLSISELKPGPYLKLTVSDTGVGMDEETMKRIFDPYFTTREVGKGSGLGLAVVHGIVKRHEGAVTVQSEPGKGATFSIYLPALEWSSVENLETRQPLPTGTGRILLIDDEQAIVKMGSAILERLGYSVTAETDSLHALETFRASPAEFDLVITDYAMPKLTGIDLVSAIRRIRPEIPVILCTGFSEKVTRTVAVELGVELIMKPFGNKQLAELVRKAMAQA